jgi:hypothetical protein
VSELIINNSLGASFIIETRLRAGQPGFLSRQGQEKKSLLSNDYAGKGSGP